jgi:GT2 family glycosyltransferase
VLEAYRSKLPMRIVRQNAAGLAAAKTLGTFMSCAPILLFVDDDDVPSPNLLTAHLSGHLQHRERGAVILGHTSLAPEIADLPLMRHVTGAGGQLFSQGWMEPGQRLTFREFWGGRSSAKRALLVEFGVFNPIFRFGCEDIELAWRLERGHGLDVIYEPAALTTMIRGLSFDDFCRRSIRQGRSQWIFASLHPHEDLRAHCEIDQGLAAWSAAAMDFAAILRHVRELDRMMQRRGPRAPPLTAQFPERTGRGLSRGLLSLSGERHRRCGTSASAGAPAGCGGGQPTWSARSSGESPDPATGLRQSEAPPPGPAVQRGRAAASAFADRKVPRRRRVDWRSRSALCLRARARDSSVERSRARRNL